VTQVAAGLLVVGFLAVAAISVVLILRLSRSSH